MTRTANALQLDTRTLLTEIDVPNLGQELSPGLYCTVELRIPRKTPSLFVLSDAIIFNRSGLLEMGHCAARALQRGLRAQEALPRNVGVASSPATGTVPGNCSCALLVGEDRDDLFLDVAPERGIAGAERWEVPAPLYHDRIILGVRAVARSAWVGRLD